MFGFYKKMNKKELGSLDDEQLADEIFGNNNILETFEELEVSQGLNAEEFKQKQEFEVEYSDAIKEVQRRNRKKGLF